MTDKKRQQLKKDITGILIYSFILIALYTWSFINANFIKSERIIFLWNKDEAVEAAEKYVRDKNYPAVLIPDSVEVNKEWNFQRGYDGTMAYNVYFKNKDITFMIVLDKRFIVCYDTYRRETTRLAFTNLVSEDLEDLNYIKSIKIINNASIDKFNLLYEMNQNGEYIGEIYNNCIEYGVYIELNHDYDSQKALDAATKVYEITDTLKKHGYNPRFIRIVYGNNYVSDIHDPENITSVKTAQEYNFKYLEDISDTIDDLYYFFI